MTTSDTPITDEQLIDAVRCRVGADETEVRRMTNRFGNKATFDEHEVEIAGERYKAFRYQFEDNPETDEPGAQGTEYYSHDSWRFESGPDYYVEDDQPHVYYDDGRISSLHLEDIREVEPSDDWE